MDLSKTGYAKIIGLRVRRTVTALTRLTSDPDYIGWHRQHMEPDCPFTDRMNLAKDEIGPHETQGLYINRHQVKRIYSLALDSYDKVW
jgi:hypothetical protein